MKSIYVRLSRHFLILLVLSSFILIPSLAAAVVEVTITHESLDENGVRTLEIRGTEVHVSGVFPTVTLAGSPLTVLSTNANGDQLVVSLPTDQLGGTYKLSLTNTAGSSTFDVNINDLSEDGSKWQEINSAVAFGKRRYFASTVYNDKMWIMGGHVFPSTKGNDVWSSSDGATWVEETSAANWAGRENFQTVTFDGKMWVIGGKTASGEVNDVWSSTDGVSWTEVTSAAQWTARANHRVVVFNNEMWLIGGNVGSTYYNDTWHSSDGITWTQGTADYGWGPNFEFQILVYDNKLWMIGGTNVNNEIQNSEDGITWTQVVQTAPFPKRHIHRSTVYKNKMWITGGLSLPAYTPLDDVWNSTDGVNWTLVTDEPGWEARYGHELLVFSDKMWALAGIGSSWYDNVWNTVDNFNNVSLLASIDVLQDQIADLQSGSVDDSADNVYITFAQEDLLSNPRTLDINGVGLFIASSDPIVFLGDEKDGSNVPLPVSNKTNIAGTTLQQVLVQLPAITSRGNHRLTLINSNGKSEFDVQLAEGGTGGNDGFTKLLLHMDTDFFDSSGSSHQPTLHGGIAIDPVAKFGAGSGLFDQIDDYVSFPDSPNWAFGSGDFTIDFWYKFVADNAQNIVSQSENINSHWRLFFQPTPFKFQFDLYSGGGIPITFRSDPLTMVAGNWYHFAVVRSGNNFNLYRNGVQIRSTYANSEYIPDLAADLNFGNLGYCNCQKMLGNIDELRISKGVARWTSDFSDNLPNAPYN